MELIRMSRHWNIKGTYINLYPDSLDRFQGQVWQTNLELSISARRILDWNTLQTNANLNDQEMVLLKLKFGDTLGLT